MRILFTGATGFIGRALSEALARRGHTVVPVRVDFAQVPGRDWWRAQLAGIDAVVNAVGILREDAGRSFEALHKRAPIELFHACVAAGVPVVVQVSALGAAADAVSPYHRSKHAADEALCALPLRGAVVQPSLVYGPGGASAALFDTLAVAPLLPLPAGGRMVVQPVHLDDVIAGIVAVLEHPPPRVETLAFAGPRAVPLRTYLEDLRTALREPGPLRVVPVPGALFLAVARVAGMVPSSFLDHETAAMLLAGNAAPSNGLPALLGHAPREPRAFVGPSEAPQRRREAQLALWLPVLRVALALLWIWTGIVSLGLYPVSESLALLARVGLQGAAATVALYGAALLDVALGVLCLAAASGWRHRVWLAQLVLVGGYTLLITIFLPEFWLHPYGPISKNLPLLGAIALLWALDRPGARAA